MEAEQRHNLTNKQTDLKEAILERIEHAKVEPYSKYRFVYQESFIWLLWVVSVCVGALATTVLLFVFTYQRFAVYEATHENILTFMVEVLPYVWVVLFVAMALVAVYNVKHTKRGYRYSISTILLSSLACSLFGGVFLHLLGFGYSVDHLLGEKMPLYASQEEMERRLWQSPEEGRLVGHQVLATLAPTSTVIFEDVHGDRWTFCVEELSEHERNLLASQKPVRMIGEITDFDMKTFHACGVIPWMLGKDMKHIDLFEEKHEFIARAEERMYRMREQLDKIEDAVLNLDAAEEELEAQYRDSSSRLHDGLCAETVVMRRLERFAR